MVPPSDRSCACTSAIAVGTQAGGGKRRTLRQLGVALVRGLDARSKRVLIARVERVLDVRPDIHGRDIRHLGHIPKLHVPVFALAD